MIVVLEYRGNSCLYFLEREHSYLWGIQYRTFEGMSVCTFGGWNVV